MVDIDDIIARSHGTVFRPTERIHAAAARKSLQDNVRYVESALFAHGFPQEKAIWLAHMLDVFTPDHYSFILVPDLGSAGTSHFCICFVDLRLPEGNQALGYVEPAETQPLLAHFLKEETNGTTKPQSDAG
jgi:hypothetical protein